ncbi:ABC transporter substrate-binding protein [Marivita hallyeonensis]|uniref:Peptide/nickel transport system substrate-binding protein n=1 Tax=Marivita hallyeonensis TaxID=996342 RepID=A0A1M5S8W3_9RHOB|nr:ABC transporter substrate-binding protein [Marivita hallyeonensis]SHH34708.1 peptide/nickel transport system substrate-binding protein [Marivita hallyeonensis]
MRYSTKTQLLTGSAIVAAGFLFSTNAVAQDVTIAFSASELGATAYNPVAASNLNTATSLIYDRLVEQDADQSFHPHLATEWEETPDGMAWTFTLLEGVTFHDDTPFNAAAVQSWIASYAGTENEYLVEAIGSVDVIDDLTVRFNMDRPEPNLLYNLASAFMGVPSPTAYAELGEDFGVTAAVGTGPYEMQTFEIGLETVLVRNEDYTWGSDLSENRGPGYIETFTFREIPDQSTAFLELRTGGIDLLLGVPTDFLAILEAEANIQVIQMPGTGISYMPINVTAPPFDDILVRQATTMAIDQDSIVAAVYGGVGAPARNFLISSLPEADVDPSLNVKYDPDRAGALLDEAGWVMGDDGVRMRNGERLSVNLFTANSTEFTRLTQVVQAQLAEIGMEATITVFDSSTIRDEYRRNAHQLAVRAYDWNNSDILDWFFSGNRLGYPNVSMWEDEEGQRLNDVAMTESATAAERIANFTAYHEYILRQHLFVPIYQPTQNIAFNAEAISVPDPVRGSRFRGQTFMDIQVVE